MYIRIIHKIASCSNTASSQDFVAGPNSLTAISMMTNPPRDIEKQGPQHPNRFHHLFLATMGWYALGHIDVKEFLQKAEDDSYWGKHNERFCEAAGQITTAVRRLVFPILLL